MVEDLIPPGWMFNSADFSARAGDGYSRGIVMLKRNNENVARWLCLDETERCMHPLWVIGTGNTLMEAVKEAVWQAAQYPVMIPVADYT